MFISAWRPHPYIPSILWVIGAPSLGLKQQGREANHSPLFNAKVKNVLTYTSTADPPGLQVRASRYRCAEQLL
jgi:hypothetical protein